MITAEQKAQRMEYLGSSDIAAILGLSPWRSAEDVRLEKTGRLTDSFTSRAAKIGTFLEEGIVNFAADEMKAKTVVHNPEFRFGTRKEMCVHLDALLYRGGMPASEWKNDKNALLEVKTGGLTGPLKGAWGEEGTDQIPDYYLVQVHYQSAVAGHFVNLEEQRHVFALLGGRGILHYEIPQDKEVEDRLLNYAEAWWKDHVVDDKPCLNSKVSPDVIKYIKREPGKCVAVPVELVSAYVSANAAKKECEEALERAKSDLIMSLGDAEYGTTEDGSSVTYREQERKECIVKASKFRVLRVKKA